MTGNGSNRSNSTGTSLEEAFALVGNETRAKIVRVLGERPHEGQSFSEIRSRVDEDIDSGQFNYHLQKLLGQFVERTDDGYLLRPSGLSLYRAIRSGTFDRDVVVEPFEAGVDCHFCGTPIEAAYEERSFAITCPGCDHVYVDTMLPPSVIGDDRDALLSRIDQFSRSRALAAARGVCPTCASEMKLEFRHGEEVWSSGSERLSVFVHRSCRNCGRQQFMSVGMAMLYHPEVVSFLHEDDRDVTTTHHWELEFAMTDDYTTVRSSDPVEIVLEVPRGDETLEVVVDDGLNVVETNRY